MGRVHDAEGEIDEAIALNFVAPASFTGEDVVELSCHGGIYVMRRVLQAVFAAGAAPAGPGEFTRRAFLNGKIGLTEAESVMQIISAQGLEAGKAAMAGRDGALERRIIQIREGLTTIAAHLDAWADYPDEDIPEVDGSGLQESLEHAAQELDRLLSQFEAGRVPARGRGDGDRRAAERGQTTLMNLLSGASAPIVTEYAGTTRDVVEESRAARRQSRCIWRTRQGLRATEDPVERIGVDRARERVQAAQLVLAVFDSSQALNEEDRLLIESVQDTPAVAVVNKSDLENVIDLEYIKNHFKQIVYISALSGDGLEALEQAVASLLKTNELDPSSGILFTERQRDAARRARDCVQEALDAQRSGVTLDAVTVSVEGAVSALLELTGERATEAVVDQVFAQFCVGK